MPTRLRLLDRDGTLREAEHIADMRPYRNPPSGQLPSAYDSSRGHNDGPLGRFRVFLRQSQLFLPTSQIQISIYQPLSKKSTKVKSTTILSVTTRWTSRSCEGNPVPYKSSFRLDGKLSPHFLFALPHFSFLLLLFFFILLLESRSRGSGFWLVYKIGILLCKGGWNKWITIFNLIYICAFSRRRPNWRSPCLVNWHYILVEYCIQKLFWILSIKIWRFQFQILESCCINLWHKQKQPVGDTSSCLEF